MPQGLQELHTAVHGRLLQWHKVFQVSPPRETFLSMRDSHCRIFLRVVPDFIVQGGDPTNTGTGGMNIRPNDAWKVLS